MVGEPSLVDLTDSVMRNSRRMLARIRPKTVLVVPLSSLNGSLEVFPVPQDKESLTVGVQWS
jgi:hypothetical protein